MRAVRRILLALGAVAILVIALVVVARATSKRIDGISCDPGTQGPYHARARLTMIVVAHKQYVYPPSGVGVSTLHLCQYWIHTPDSSGTIAVDAPHRVVPTLGQFFDVWGQPLAWPRVWRYSAGTGALLAYVAGRLHPGDPRMIKLYDGTTVTLVIGSDWSSMPQQPTAFTQ